MNSRSTSIVAAIALATGLSVSAPAQLVPQNFWHMGEDNATNPTDAVGGRNFDGGFTTTVSTEHAPNSTKSVYYNGFAGNYFNNDSSNPAGGPVVPADNWALELWVNLNSFSGDVNIASLGTQNGGWAKIGLSGGQTVFFGRENEAYGAASSTPLALHTWTHLAYVQMGGTIHGYVNGVEVAAYDSVTASHDNNGQMHLGVRPDGGQNLDGYLDEVRFSTFAPGTFNTSQLLVNAAPVPEPASMAALGLGALALLRRRAARKA